MEASARVQETQRILNPAPAHNPKILLVELEAVLVYLKEYFPWLIGSLKISSSDMVTIRCWHSVSSKLNLSIPCCHQIQNEY